MRHVDDQEQQLREDLLAFIRAQEKPSAASIIVAYKREHPEVEAGAIRVAMMKLLDAGHVTVGDRWRLILRGTP
jgi:hypothetical protein